MLDYFSGLQLLLFCHLWLEYGGNGKCLSFVCFCGGKSLDLSSGLVACAASNPFCTSASSSNNTNMRRDPRNQPWVQPPTNILFQQKFLGSLSARSYLPEVQISSHADLFPSGPLLKCWFGLISPLPLGPISYYYVVGGCDCGRKCPSRIRGLVYYCNAITTL